jgi:hypothetical protein
VLNWTSGMETIMLEGGITADCNSEVGELIEVVGSFCGIGLDRGLRTRFELNKTIASVYCINTTIKWWNELTEGFWPVRWNT